ICSNCGHQQKMPLNVRTYKCSECGFTADRDFNAAVNLENYLKN
ncbi:MAG: zinc ribbon domain-containing protein, partial [Trichodesmium sp.]